MKKSLVIVESPTKARTISRFLQGDFVVESSYGHIRDLPSSKLGVDVEHDFAPSYVIPLKARANVKKLKQIAAKAGTVILATDEDREGEAIAWHLSQALGLGNDKTQTTHSKQKVERIVFHEITEHAIKEALMHPRTVDMHLVDAQQARRVLDRLVGYKLSPFLWKKIYRGLSAGRVQSVAVRLIVEREREITAFVPKEYWTIEAHLAKENQEETFTATLSKIDGKAVEKFDIGTKEAAEEITRNLERASWEVGDVERRAVTKNPLPPFMTSTLQQDAFRRLGFSARQTMRVAQQLYEGVPLGSEGPVGLITYMRTDSLNIAQQALGEAALYIKKAFGDQYALAAPRRFKTKSKGAQEAHEAIRPTDPSRTPEGVKPYLDARQFRLYQLIWQRFLATQMPSAIFDATGIDIIASPKPSTLNPKPYLFRATGQIQRFDGFLKVYPVKFAENALPDVAPKEAVRLMRLAPEQHFTEPPPRFTEATLVKALEADGIGRPSTYAPIISTIQDRKYVERHDRRSLKPTDIGFLVNDLLVEHFPQVVDVQFTARMEEEFDAVAEGKMAWQPVIKEFYEPFAKNLEQKYEEVKKHHADEATDEVCEKCGKAMVIKLGRFGKFLACTGFPECRNTKPLAGQEKQAPQTIGMQCPKCPEGEIVIRRTRRGKIFYGCLRYPKCDYASWDDPRNPPKEKKKKAEI